MLATRFNPGDREDAPASLHLSDSRTYMLDFTGEPGNFVGAGDQCSCGSSDAASVGTKSRDTPRTSCHGRSCHGRAAALLLLAALALRAAPGTSASLSGAPGSRRLGAACRPWRGRAARRPLRRQRPLRAAGTQEALDDAVRALEGTLTDRKVQQARLRRSTGTWRRESGSWAPAPPPLSGGEVLVRNVKHGPNLLTTFATEFPPYNDIRLEHIDRGIEWMHKSSWRDTFALYYIPTYTTIPWETIMHPMEIAVDKIERLFATIKHVRNVMDNSPKMQKVWSRVLSIRSSSIKAARSSEQFLTQFKRLLQSDQQTEAQRRAVAYQLLIFEHDGVNVQEYGRHRDDPIQFLDFNGARTDLLNVSQEWETNIDNDMARKSFLVRDAAELRGVPAHVLADAAHAAVKAGYPKATAEAGPWMVTLDDAMVDPILRHAKGRTFREFVYGTRARIAFLGGSGLGDNTPLVTRILKGRKIWASALGYSSWADLEFIMRMSTLEQVYAFLARLRRESLPAARRELLELQEFANSQGGTYDLEHFDLDYWRERLLESRFSLREGYLRQFFPLPAVLDGLFALLRRLFGVEVVPADGETQVWDERVRFFRLREAETGEPVASFFLDAQRRRGSKRPGFWVETIQEYSTALGDERSGPRRPAVHVVCDFEPAVDDKPVLLTHREVAKLFHVMGGALRHLLCNQTEGLVAGTNSMEIDVRDFPAYFLERWAWDKSTIRSMSRHVETGDPLPEPAIDMIAASRTFHNGMRVLKRTAQAQIDLDLHAQYDPQGEMAVSDVVKIIEAEFAVIPPRVEDHELCSMPIHGERGSALFTDLWSEALAADLLLEFEEVGFDNAEAVARLGRRLRGALLAPGAGRAPALAFQDFHGRPPSFVAFLRHLGLAGGRGPGGADEGDYEDGDGDGYEDVYEEDDDYVEFDGPGPDAGRPGGAPEDTAESDQPVP